MILPLYKRILQVASICFVIWIFGRPLSTLGLLAYNISGAYLNSLFVNIKQTKKEASDLLLAQARVKQLEIENKKLILANTKLKSKAQKIKTLETQLEFKNYFSYDTIPATIIGRSPDNWHKQVIINKGSKHGVKIGKGVLTPKGIVGQVAKVGRYSSVVQLAFNPNFKMGVKIKELNQYGILIGDYPDSGHLEFITVDSQVAVGDQIVTSGICLDPTNCPYPENFPVGEVVEVGKNPDVVDLMVEIKLYEDLNDVREVFVLL